LRLALLGRGRRASCARRERVLWAGKAERLSFDVPTLPLFVHERLSTKGIIETLKGHKLDPQLGLYPARFASRPPSRLRWIMKPLP